MNLYDSCYYCRTECEEQIKGFSGAVFKKFKTQNEATQFIQEKRLNLASTQAASTSLSVSILQLNKTFDSKIEIELVFFLQRNVAADASKKRTLNGPNTGTVLQPRTKKAKIDDAKTIDYTSNIVRSKKYGEYEFLEDDKGYVHVYTDGSCENNGRSNAVAGYGVYFGEGHTL